MFKIRPGRYVVPGVGKVDANKEVSPEVAIKLYKSRAFPWIEPVIKKETIDFLKKSKLSEQEVASLIQAAKTVEEVDFLLDVKSNKALEGIAATKKTALGSVTN